MTGKNPNDAPENQAEFGERPTWPSIVPDQPVEEQTKGIASLKAPRIDDRKIEPEKSASPEAIEAANYIDIVAGGKTGPSVSMNGAAKALTHVGKRTNNEDGMLVTNDAIAVADGLGGHTAGEIASSLALITTGQYISDKEYPLVEIFKRACDALYERDPDSDSGTTLALARRQPLEEGLTRYEVAHVGDTKIIAFSRKYKKKVYESRDQSMVQRQIEAKMIESIDRYSSPLNSRITNSVQARGMDLDPSFHTIDWEDGDLITVIYSDGVADYVSPEEVINLYFKLSENKSPKYAKTHYHEEIIALALGRQKKEEGFDLTFEGKKHHIKIKGDQGDNATVAILQ